MMHRCSSSSSVKRPSLESQMSQGQTNSVLLPDISPSLLLESIKLAVPDNHLSHLLGDTSFTSTALNYLSFRPTEEIDMDNQTNDTEVTETLLQMVPYSTLTGDAKEPQVESVVVQSQRHSKPHGNTRMTATMSFLSLITPFQKLPGGHEAYQPQGKAFVERTMSRLLSAMTVRKPFLGSEHYPPRREIICSAIASCISSTTATDEPPPEDQIYQPQEDIIINPMMLDILEVLSVEEPLVNDEIYSPQGHAVVTPTTSDSLSARAAKYPLLTDTACHSQQRTLITLMLLLHQSSSTASAKIQTFDDDNYQWQDELEEIQDYRMEAARLVHIRSEPSSGLQRLVRTLRLPAYTSLFYDRHFDGVCCRLETAETFKGISESWIPRLLDFRENSSTTGSVFISISDICPAHSAIGWQFCVVIEPAIREMGTIQDESKDSVGVDSANVIDMQAIMELIEARSNGGLHGDLQHHEKFRRSEKPVNSSLSAEQIHEAISELRTTPLERHEAHTSYEMLALPGPSQESLVEEMCPSQKTRVIEPMMSLSLPDSSITKLSDYIMQEFLFKASMKRSSPLAITAERSPLVDQEKHHSRSQAVIKSGNISPSSAALHRQLLGDNEAYQLQGDMTRKFNTAHSTLPEAIEARQLDNQFRQVWEESMITSFKSTSSSVTSAEVPLVRLSEKYPLQGPKVTETKTSSSSSVSSAVHTMIEEKKYQWRGWKAMTTSQTSLSSAASTEEPRQDEKLCQFHEDAPLPSMLSRSLSAVSRVDPLVGTKIYHGEDGMEDLEKYLPGGFHPVHLGDEYSGGRYRIIYKLGYGGYSTVWLAKDRHALRYVAIKFVAAEPSRDSSEGRILRLLCDTKPVTGTSGYVSLLYDEFYVDGPNGHHLCLVTEAARCPIEGFKNGITNLLPLDLARVVIAQILLGLKHIHSCGVVHGDFHLGNLLLRSPQIDSLSIEQIYKRFGEPITEPVERLDGATPGPEAPLYTVWPRPLVIQSDGIDDAQIMISDFGVSWLSDAKSRDELLIHILYRAPEAFFAKGSIGKPVDVWALACAIFELIGDAPLFHSGYFVFHDKVIAEMVSALGSLPQQWWESWEARSQFFHEDGSWNAESKFDFSPRSRPLLQRIQENGRQDDPEFSSEEVESLERMLSAMLVYDPTKRATAGEVVESDWMRRWGLPALKKFL